MYEYTHMSDFIKILCVDSHSHSYSCKVIFYRKICIRFEIGSKYYIGYILKYLCSLISCEPYICTSVGILLSTSLRKSISFLVHCYFLCFYIYFSLLLSLLLSLSLSLSIFLPSKQRVVFVMTLFLIVNILLSDVMVNIQNFL